LNGFFRGISKTPRKVIVQMFERTAVALLLVDLIIYSVGVFWLGSRLQAAQRERDELYRRVSLESEQVARLGRFETLLPGVDHALQAFEQGHVPPRRRGFSRGARLVRKIASASGVELAGVAYKLDSRGGQPLRRLAINVVVEGPFDGLVKFSHSLETASDFVVVREFNLQPVEGGSLSLKISADLYLVP
jgi:Tfp pilus assembly protein PilO